MGRQAGQTLQSSGAAATGALKEEIRRLAPWFHNLHLPGGARTAPDHPLGDFPAFKWRQIEKSIPRDLQGWTALDVGCNAGFYSFELAKRGAEVLGVDVDAHYLAQAQWASKLQRLEKKIRFERATVYDIARREQQHDLVLFLGVFYHLRHPLLALDALAARTRRLLVFQTLTTHQEWEPPQPPSPVFADLDIDSRERLRDEHWPRMAFIEHCLAGDPTNWWAPDANCCEAMLRSAGLRIVDRPAHETWVCEPDPSLRDRAHDEQWRNAIGLE